MQWRRLVLCRPTDALRRVCYPRASVIAARQLRTRSIPKRPAPLAKFTNQPRPTEDGLDEHTKADKRVVEKIGDTEGCGIGQVETPLRVLDSILEYWSETPKPSIEQKVFANRLFTKNDAKMLFTAGSLHQVTYTDVPEVAFLGRSNSGKSTMINALLGKVVARTSAKPGKTKTLNAWAVGGMDRTGQKHRLTVLDMPGYGHGSQGEWGAVITKYLGKRKELKRVFLLINAEHGLKNNDKQMLQALREAGIPHQVVWAKIDRLIVATKKPPESTSREFDYFIGAQNRLRVEQHVQTLRQALEAESKQGGLPARGDSLACSGSSGGLPGEAPEPKGSLGVAALRWAVVSAAGLQPQRLVKDVKDINFS